MAKSGRADILKMLFWPGIFEILAKTLLSLSRIPLDKCNYEQGTTITFAVTCLEGQARFNFHLPYSNFHLSLKKCMFYNVSFKIK